MGYLRYEPSDYYAEMRVRMVQRRRSTRKAALAVLLGLLAFAVLGAIFCG